MAYIVTRNKESGFVALVEKRRVPVAGGTTAVRNVGYVCGLGTMTQSEFEEFRDWAHAITHQETRKEAVLACPRVIVKKEKTEATVAAAQQKKTTVKPMRKAKTVWKPKVTVKKNFPVPTLSGYRGKTHTQMMAERKKEASLKKRMEDEAARVKEGKPEKAHEKTAGERAHKGGVKGIFQREAKKTAEKKRRAAMKGFMFD